MQVRKSYDQKDIVSNQMRQIARQRKIGVSQSVNFNSGGQSQFANDFLSSQKKIYEEFDQLKNISDLCINTEINTNTSALQSLEHTDEQSGVNSSKQKTSGGDIQYASNVSALFKLQTQSTFQNRYDQTNHSKFSPTNRSPDRNTDHHEAYK